MMENFSVADASQVEVLVVALASLLAGSLSGMTGFGGGLLLPPVLAPIIGVKSVVPVMSVAMLMANSHRVWLYRDRLNRRLTLTAIGAAMPGVLIGASVYVRLPAQVIAVILGVFLLVAVPVGRHLASRSLVLSRRQMAAGCALYGLGSGTTTGVGMFLVPILLGSGLTGAAFLATDAAVAVAMNLSKAVLFGSYSLIDLQLLAMGVLMGLCTFPGNYLGRWILGRTTLRVHRGLMESLIVFGGLSLLWRPVRELLATL